MTVKAHTFCEGTEKGVFLLDGDTKLVRCLEQLGEDELQDFGGDVVETSLLTAGGVCQTHQC